MQDFSRKFLSGGSKSIGLADPSIINLAEWLVTSGNEHASSSDCLDSLNGNLGELFGAYKNWSVGKFSLSKDLGESLYKHTVSLLFISKIGDDLHSW